MLISKKIFIILIFEINLNFELISDFNFLNQLGLPILLNLACLSPACGSLRPKTASFKSWDNQVLINFLINWQIRYENVN